MLALCVIIPVLTEILCIKWEHEAQISEIRSRDSLEMTLESLYRLPGHVKLSVNRVQTALCVWKQVSSFLQCSHILPPTELYYSSWGLSSPHSHRVKLNPVWELRGARLNLSHVQSTALPTLYCQFHTKLPDILLDIPAIKCMATQDKWTRKIRRIDIYYVVEIKSASYVDMMDGLSAGFCPGFYKTSDYRLWKLNFLILTLLVKIQLKMVSMTRKNKLAVPFKLLNVQLLCSTTSFRYG